MSMKIAVSAIKSYAEALKKQSILQTNNVLKPAKDNCFGWVRPDGAISFADMKSVIKYARTTIVNDLKMAVPKERAVIAEGNLVTYSKLGTERNCEIPADAKGLFFHGHTPNPDGSTNTFSTVDYRTFIESPELETAIVFNPEGEYAMMKKLPLEYGWFSKILTKIFPQKMVDAAIKGGRLGWLESKYAQLMCKLNDKVLNRKVQEASRKQIWARLKGDPKYKQYKAEFDKVANEQLINFNTANGAKEMDKLWQRNQKRLGIEYEMNFSALKDK